MALTQDDISAGMFVTVLKGPRAVMQSFFGTFYSPDEDAEDKRLNGVVLFVRAINRPYVVCSIPGNDGVWHKTTIDLREVQFIAISEEYIRAAIGEQYEKMMEMLPKSPKRIRRPRLPARNCKPAAGESSDR